MTTPTSAQFNDMLSKVLAGTAALLEEKMPQRTVRRTLEEVLALRTPEYIAEFKRRMDAITEEDIRRQMIEDGEDPDEEPQMNPRAERLFPGMQPADYPRFTCPRCWEVWIEPDRTRHMSLCEGVPVRDDIALVTTAESGDIYMFASPASVAECLNPNLLPLNLDYGGGRATSPDLSVLSDDEISHLYRSLRARLPPTVDSSPEELRQKLAELYAKITAMMSGDWPAIFWLKTRAGWREADVQACLKERKL